MAPRIFWIGDSTVQFNNISTWPQCGMGQVLDLYVRPGIAVYDHARNGRSTKRYPAYLLLQSQMPVLKPYQKRNF